MAAYVALIRKEKKSSYGVDFPDFPGCISAGKTLDDALKSAGEALAPHLRGMLEDGDAIPAPSALAEVLKYEHHRNAVAILVQAPTPKGKAVRLNITIDEGLLKQIDDAAAARGMTRPGFLAEAARDAMQ